MYREPVFNARLMRSLKEFLREVINLEPWLKLMLLLKDII